MDSFDVGDGGISTVKNKETNSVSNDGKLTLTRQDDTEKHIIASVLFLNNAAFTDIAKPLVTFSSKANTSVTISFAKPTETNISAGTVTFEITYSEQ